MYIIKLETSSNASTSEKSHIVVSLTLRAKVEVLSRFGREFHNLGANYEKECSWCDMLRSCIIFVRSFF